MNPDDDTLPASSLDAAAPPGRSTDLQTIGRFAVQTKLGEGGMGVVLLASDPLLGRQVAIKVLRGSAIDDSAKRRLLREAQGTAKLSHENVIVVHDVGTHEDQVYLAMEYVAGETLRKRQARRGWREIVELYTRAGRGLQAAHDAGLVHRDFKPDNVLVGTDGRLRVTDFGLVATIGAKPDPVATPSSRPSELISKLTETGAIMGTPRYMAPEQHLGEQVDPRADQFAFCVALYEALYGQQPFAGATYPELTENVLDGKLVAPPESDVPPRVRDAVLRGLSRDRRDRHESIRDLLSLFSIDVPAAPRRRWPLAAAIAVGVVAIVVGVLVLAQRSADETPASAPVAEASTSELDIKLLGPAQQAFEQGRFNFLGGDYDAAARNFVEAYAALEVPQMFYNLAASYYMKARRDGDATSYRRAAGLYQQYLFSDPIASGVSDAVVAINAEAARLDAGGDRGSPSPAIRRLEDPEIRGFVIVISNPKKATVYIDDSTRPLGTTPWSATLDGAHKIVLAKPGYKQGEHRNTFDRSKLMVLSYNLGPSN